MWTFLNVIPWVMIGAQPPRRKYVSQEIISFRGSGREKMYPKAVSDILLELLMVSLKFEGCKPVEGSGVTGADTRAGLHQARCNYLMLMDQCKNEQLKHSY